MTDLFSKPFCVKLSDVFFKFANSGKLAVILQDRIALNVYL